MGTGRGCVAVARPEGDRTLSFAPASDVANEASAEARIPRPTEAPDVLSLKPGEHLCLVYDDDPAEQLGAMIPYLKQGLDGGERAVYVCDDNTLDDVRAALEESGVDVERATSQGSLVLWTREQWRGAGELDSVQKAVEVRQTIADALAAGYTAIRFGVEMTWTLGPDIPSDRLLDWESTLNTILMPGVPARAICQYSRQRLPPDVLYAALATHPVAVVGMEAFPNPYYRGAPGAARPSPQGPLDTAWAGIDWMLSQIKWQRSYESERAQRIEAERAFRVAQASADELRTANAAKDDVLALLSHELRTPLTLVGGFAEFLRRTSVGASPEAEQAIQEITLGAQRLTRIVANLLLLAQGERASEADFEPILLGPIVAAVLAEHRKQHGGREVSVHHEARHTPARGNSVFAEQVIANLVNNAEKYSPAGTEIEIRLTVAEGYCVVSVLDRGIGFPNGDALRLFVPFYRSPEAKRLGSGLGIGLSVCKRAVEVQGGTIWCTPREGGGSEFSFTLPLAEDND